MFSTFNSCGAKSVRNYAEAVRNLEAAQLTPTGRRKVMKDYGWQLGSKNTRIRQSGDAIVMRLHNTDVVTWHPDETIEIDNWSSQLTAAFIRHFTPLSAGADSTLTYFPEITKLADDDWRGRWASARVVHGDVRFVLTDEGHRPDLDTCDTFRWLAVSDRKATRQLSAEYHIAEFKNWLFMALPMLDLQHEGTDLAECATALKDKRFRDAARHLPSLTLGRGFDLLRRCKPLKIGGVRYDEPVTMASVDRVRDYIYDQEGLLDTLETKELSPGELAQRTKRNAAYAKADAGGWNLGWGR
jgi:hypothetical protein